MKSVYILLFCFFFTSCHSSNKTESNDNLQESFSDSTMNEQTSESNTLTNSLDINTTTSTREEIDNESHSQKITKEEQVAFWNSFRKHLLNTDIKKLSTMVQFPLYGDGFLYRVYYNGDDEKVKVKMNEKFKNFQKTDFENNWGKIFEKTFIQLIRKIDFEKALNDPESYKVNIIENGVEEHSLYMNIYENEEEDRYNYSLNYGFDGHDGISEHGELYHIRKDKDGNIRLYLIQAVG